MTFEQNIKLWNDTKNLDENLKTEMKKMSQAELQEAFSVNLEFGTAGIRGIIGAGTGRMNKYTIRRATLALIKHLQETYSKSDLLEKGVLIGHDSRHFSREFAIEVASFLSAANIKAILFYNNDLRPTPLVSFGVKYLNAIAGAVITASHNSREYNGFKVYDENGCQYLPIVTDKIGEYFQKITTEVFENPLVNKELIVYANKNVDDAYIEEIKNLQFFPKAEKRLKVVFSNLHGTCSNWTDRILKECGYDVIVVEEQYENDPDFTHAKNPNPELPETFDLAIKYAKKYNADLIILNDPDGDRVGIAVPQKNGEFYLLNGNETAPILLEYLLSNYKKNKTLPKNGIMYNTFVTGNLSDKVAESYGLKVVKTLTGFKWIGGEMAKEHLKNEKFVFGFEEAYGYVIKDITRDKDGIQSAMVLAEAANYYLQQEKTLLDVLEDLYKKHGHFYFYTVNIVKKGLEGQKAIKKMLKNLRDKEITSLNNIACTKKEDYINGLYNMPGQDLLKFYFEDGSWFAVRASGTEPKIKFYFVCVDNSVENAKIKQNAMFSDLEKNYL